MDPILQSVHVAPPCFCSQERTNQKGTLERSFNVFFQVKMQQNNIDMILLDYNW